MGTKIIELDNISTETNNKISENIDSLNTIDIVKIINDEDKKVTNAIENILPKIASAIDDMEVNYKDGGRLIYIGAGTSGRIGIMDAVELLPTYSVSSEKAIGIIAGGEGAFIRAVEGAEDNEDLAINDLQNIELNEKDIVIGLAASGRTPYTISALNYANKVGSLTIGISCNKNGLINKVVKHPICIETGPEVVSGSTRMKAGTAQKMVCNMLSTSLMIKLGYVYKNHMIYVKPTNDKLVERSKKMIMNILDVDYNEATELFEKSDHVVANAIVIHKTNCDLKTAQHALEKSGGKVTNAINIINR